MSLAAANNSGINGAKAKNFSSMFGGAASAKVASTTGSPTATSYSLNGITYDVYTWLSGTGSITFSAAGYIDFLLCSGGGSSGTSSSEGYFSGGGGGGCYTGPLLVSATSYSVTVAAASSGNSATGNSGVFGSLTIRGGRGGDSGRGGTGGSSGNGFYGAYGVNSGGGAGAAADGLPYTFSGPTGGAGVFSTIRDGSTNVQYGRGGGLGESVASANLGMGGTSPAVGQFGNGGSGIVIVRVAR